MEKKPVDMENLLLFKGFYHVLTINSIWSLRHLSLGMIVKESETGRINISAIFIYFDDVCGILLRKNETREVDPRKACRYFNISNKNHTGDSWQVRFEQARESD